MADTIEYCLENVTDYTQYERLCSDLMSAAGYIGIEPLGGTNDGGRDALFFNKQDSATTIFAFTVRKDWQRKLIEDAQRVKALGHKCENFCFVCTARFSASERDEAIDRIRVEFGWHLKLFGARWIRALLSGSRPDLLGRHAAIFDPVIVRDAPRGDLRIRINPTRNEHQQLAQITVLNRGTRPVLVKAWHAYWGVGVGSFGTQSAMCASGKLPVRLAELEESDFLVRIDDGPVRDLRVLGVVDADDVAWDADEKALAAFIKTAQWHMPPPPPTAVESNHPDQSVDIIAEVLSDRGRDLSITLTNHGPKSLSLAGARIEWEYAPARELSVDESGQKVAEVAGAVDLRRVDGCQSVPVGASAQFELSPEMRNVLVAVLASDVHNENISVLVGTTGNVAWRESGTTVAGPIKEAARRIHSSWAA